MDDLLSCSNPIFEKYLYNSQTDENDIKGIYPPSLKLNCEQESNQQVSFLDVLIYKHKGIFSTKIYDKREHPPLSRVNQRQYPDPSCFLSERSKYGIITSRLHCFGRICLRKKDFMARTHKFLKEFYDRGYSKSKINKYVKKFLRGVPLEFPIGNLGTFVKTLTNT